jgi:hypothetical protein
VEEELRFGGLGRRVSEDGDVAVWMEAVGEPQAGCGLDSQAQRACTDATVWLHLNGGTLAEDVSPPGAFGRWAQCRAAFGLSLLPSGERGHRQFAVSLVLVAMEAEFGQQSIGRRKAGDAIAGEQRGQAVLPVLMAALDFALGLWRGGVAEGDAVEVKRRTELGEGGGDRGEKEAMAIDVEAQREAMGEEGPREEVEVGEERFGGIDLRAVGCNHRAC